MKQNIYDISVNKIDGKSLKLGEFKGKVLLVVNVASKCGLTPQYEGLEKLYEQYQDQGFEVLGFPANEFLGQEPGSNTEIQEFCQLNFGVKFPMFSKIVVKGPGQHPLYQELTQAKPQAETPQGSDFEKKLEGFGQKRTHQNDILWNFEKFLVDRQGQVTHRFSPDMKPEDPVIQSAIKSAL